MDYTIAFLVLIFAIGFVGSFISGMVGIGGAIINYPMLLFIPSLLDLLHLVHMKYRELVQSKFLLQQ